MNLLTLGNPKTAKGEGRGYLTGILHLSPADTAGAFYPELSGRNVCPMAGHCKALCLNTAGRGGIAPATGERFAISPAGISRVELPNNAIQRARARRTRLYWQDRAGFISAIVEDLAELSRIAGRHGLKPAARLNGTSDLPAIPLADSVQNAARAHGVTLYDYTKLPGAWNRSRENYHLTYSLDGPERVELARENLSRGVNVAVVFRTPKGAPLPATFLGAPVIDGDATDLRFLDPRPVVVGLRAKGRARRSDSPFIFHG